MMNLTSDGQTTLLVSLQPQIEQMARGYYYRVPGLKVSLEDLIQEAMIGIWKAIQRHDESRGEQTFTNYCLKYARGAMLHFLTRTNRTPAISLEAFLDVETSDGTMRREIADAPVPHRLASRSERRRVLAALRTLTMHQRLCVMAAYRIEDERGRVLSKEQVKAQLHLSDKAFDNNRRRALGKLADLLSDNPVPQKAQGWKRCCYICQKSLTTQSPGACYSLPCREVVVCRMCNYTCIVEPTGAIVQREFVFDLGKLVQDLIPKTHYLH